MNIPDLYQLLGATLIADEAALKTAISQMKADLEMKIMI
jgi:hypothetical protein